jgi:intein/homing endonuclease
MATKDEKIIEEARKRWKRCQEWESYARARYEDDIRFANGDSDNNYQWPSSIVKGRTDEARPCLTINKTRQHCLQIINDARQNKPGIEVRPVGDQATYDAAKIYEGVVRHIEYISNAQQAYDTAVWHQVMGGIGYWRVLTDYVSDDTFDQEIYIRRINDPLTVYLDPDIQQYDGSDARFGFVFRDMPRDEFEETYPRYKDKLGDMPLNDGAGWNDEHHIRVAEYYRKVEKRDRLLNLDTGEAVRASTIPPNVRELMPNDVIDDAREITEYEIEWYLIAGNKVLERRIWPGKYIPLVRVVGEEVIIDKKLDRRGHTRALKDPQRMYNYWSPLSLETPLPTPSGWTKMGDVRPGDWLLDEGGKPVEVAGVSPIHINRECYLVRFDDGSGIVADAGHKWTVEERGKRKTQTWEWFTKTVTTQELTPNKHFIWAAKPLDLPKADLPLDPYVLGVWLGDGTATKPDITAGPLDAEDMRVCLAASGYNIGPAKTYNGNRGAAVITIYGIWNRFVALGLAGNKHIPEIYLRASYEQRLALLQGLMDTDGSIASANRQCSFTTISPALAEGFAELLRSLGIKAVRCVREAKARMFPSGNTYNCKEAIQFSFSIEPDMRVFRLPRKAVAQGGSRNLHSRRTKRHRISSVTKVPSVPVKCVTINSASHLFLAGEGMVPTHNSSVTEYVALQTKTPYIAASEAIEGHQQAWEESNRVTRALLPFKAFNDQGQPLPVPQRVQPPAMPDAFIKGLQIAQQELMLVSGQYQAIMGEPSNETSGKAINARQRQGDNATYHFIDHLASAVRFTGRILIDLIPKVYDTQRVMLIMAEDGSQEQVNLNPQLPVPLAAQQNPLTGAVQRIFNPAVGRYEVEADIGPAYATRRQEAFNAFMQIASQNSALVGVIGDLMFKAADFPMADEISERLHNMLPPQALGGPSPQMQQMQAEAQKQIGNLQKLASSLADQLAKAQIELKQKNDKSQLEVYDAETRRMAAVGNIDPEALRPIVRELVSQALGTPIVPIMAAHAAADQARQPQPEPEEQDQETQPAQ